MDPRSSLAEHLAFFGELGVSGVSRDHTWRDRPGDLAVLHGDAAVEADATRRVVPRRASEAAVQSVSVAANPISLSMLDPVPVPQSRVGAQALAQIREELGDCTRCPLHIQRTQIVFGVGHPESRAHVRRRGPGSR